MQKENIGVENIIQASMILLQIIEHKFYYSPIGSRQNKLQVTKALSSMVILRQYSNYIYPDKL